MINTLGFTNGLCPQSVINDHYSFDLNDAQFKDEWPRFQTHDLIIAGEVIEHLLHRPDFGSWLSGVLVGNRREADSDNSKRRGNNKTNNSGIRT